MVSRPQRYSFSDGEPENVWARSVMKDGNGWSATPVSDASSVDECLHHVLEPTPPLPTQPSISATTSLSNTTASALASSQISAPVTPPTKGSTTFLSRIGSVKKWGVRRRRGTSSTPSEVLGGFFFLFLYLSHYVFGDAPFVSFKKDSNGLSIELKDVMSYFVLPRFHFYFEMFS